MTIEEFEELARAADRIAEGVRLEFVNGKLGAKAVPDGDHSRIIQWLIRIFLTARPDLFLTPVQGLQKCRGASASYRASTILRAQRARHAKYGSESAETVRVRIQAGERRTASRRSSTASRSSFAQSRQAEAPVRRSSTRAVRSA
ncbi:hypothetical protein [Nocardia sp. NBC_01388]|uniref:hypothetical protein n=1 Tax=Nocardia sp. NBC_01388 TaxID=2903596 RepID=UPI003867E7D7